MLSSEAVAGGHPDKIADQVSDAILDEYLRSDPASRVACEVLWTGRLLVIGGEITSTANVDRSGIALRVLSDYGYSCDEVRDAVIAQSPEIAGGVFGSEQGAGDQGIMFGYATNETESGLWLPHDLALRLMHGFTEHRLDGFLGDAKSQVTVDHEGVVQKVVLSAAHTGDLSLDEVRDLLTWHVERVLAAERVSPSVDLLLNPAGLWTISGADADAGLTGRKIIVDTYGGRVPHGGGAFSGKDPSKVDRSAAYMARAIAKALVLNGNGGEILVQIGYAIGVAEPVSVAVCNRAGDEIEYLSKWVKQRIDLRPAAIIERLGLREFTSYEQTAAGGHFSRDWFPWERVEGLAAELG